MAVKSKGGSVTGKVFGGAAHYSSLQELLEVAGTGAVTVYWNRSKPNPNVWRFGELLISGLVSVNSGNPNATLTRLSTGVFTGALIDLVTASGSSSAGITSVLPSASRPLPEVVNW